MNRIRQECIYTDDFSKGKRPVLCRINDVDEEKEKDKKKKKKSVDISL